MLGESLRRLLLDRGDVPIAERAEALLMGADRAQHVAEVVRPALEAGTWVVTDRYSASTLAYQGFGRGLDRTELDPLIAWATHGIGPDLNVLVDVPVEVGVARRGAEAADHFEDQGDTFLQRVASGYRSLAGERMARGWWSTAPARWTMWPMPSGPVSPFARDPSRPWLTPGTAPSGAGRGKPTDDVAEVPVPALFDRVVGQPRAVAAHRAAGRRPSTPTCCTVLPVRASARRPGLWPPPSSVRMAGAATVPTCKSGTPWDPPRSGGDRAVRRAPRRRRGPFDRRPRPAPPSGGSRQVLVVDDVHLAGKAVPALLKTVEEPPPTTVFVLLADNTPPELDTIVSRCVTISRSGSRT